MPEIEKASYNKGFVDMQLRLKNFKVPFSLFLAHVTSPAPVIDNSGYAELLKGINELKQMGAASNKFFTNIQKVPVQKKLTEEDLIKIKDEQQAAKIKARAIAKLADKQKRG